MSWQRVAAMTLQSHLRSPWAPVFLVVALAPLLLFALAGLLWDRSVLALVFSPSLEGFSPSLSGGVGAVLSGIVLARVVLSFRGAWLTDPEGARERIPGYFAGTVAALAAGVLAWGLATFLVSALSGHPVSGSLRGAVSHVVATLLLGAAWVAVLLLVCVRLEDTEGRWAGAFLAWGLLAFVVPTIPLLALASLGGGFLDGLIPVPPWVLLVDALSPWRAHELLVDAAGGAGFWGAAYGNSFPRLFNPFTFIVVLLAWTAIPLALAARLQARRDGHAFAPEVAP